MSSISTIFSYSRRFLERPICIYDFSSTKWTFDFSNIDAKPAIVFSESSSVDAASVTASLGDFVFGGAYTHPELTANGVEFVTDLVEIKFTQKRPVEANN